MSLREPAVYSAKPLRQILDPKTGKTQVRFVDTSTEAYEVARRYMIRLEREDFEDERQLKALAEQAKTTPEQFKAEFGYLVGL